MTAEELKKSILQQAIQGKLVPQNPADETASTLLDRIREEKSRLVAEGKIKRDKNESVIFRTTDGRYMERIGKTETDITDKIPFEIPDSWKWGRVKTVGLCETGTTPSKEHLEYFGDYIPFLGPANIQNNQIISVTQGLSFEGSKFGRIVPKDTILQVCIGGSIGKCAIVDKEVTFNQQINSVTPIIANVKYLFACLQSDSFFQQIKIKSTGTATPIINRGNWESLLIPIPPLAEQKRIVEKIEELMPLVEEYGKAQSRLDELNSSLGNRLFKSVLQYAIQGKLVPQNPEDEPASTLLNRISDEKARLISEGKIKRDKNESVIYRTDDGRYIERIGKTETDITEKIPFEIPNRWEWSKLENITYSVGGKYNQIQSKEVLKNGAIPVVSQGQNLIDGYCEDREKIIYDLPLVMFGDHTRNVKYIDFPFVVCADGTKFHKCILVLPKYIYYWMTIMADQLRDRGYARHYSLLKKEFIPLPPLEEQKRIVERIEQILSLCK